MEGFGGGVDHRRMTAETEVIIAGQIQQGLLLGLGPLQGPGQISAAPRVQRAAACWILDAMASVWAVTDDQDGCFAGR